MAPVLADDLHCADCPAVTLGLERAECIGQQPPSVAAIGVLCAVARFEQPQSEFRILRNGIGVPAADLLERAPPDEQHRPVRDGGVHFVPLHHSDIEKSGVFGVHHRLEQAVFTIAVILRRLDECQLRVGEKRNEVLQPRSVHDVVRIEQCDYFRGRVDLRHRLVERTRLEAGDRRKVDEFEPRPEAGAMCLDGPPEGFIRRVVDDHQHFEARIIEPGRGIQGLDQHRGVLAIRRNLNRDHGENVVGQRCGR